MKVLDLFSGIGGFSLGLERAGMKTIGFCEIDPYCREILHQHWPGVPIFDDVRSLDGRQFKANVDVVAGGFPCQDLSTAGKGKGIQGDRSGLWSEMCRVIDEVEPRYAIMENVTALISGDRGRWFGTVLGDLASIGFDAEWHCIPASAVGANHQRDRIWIVAYPNNTRQQPGAGRGQGDRQAGNNPGGLCENVPYSNSQQVRDSEGQVEERKLSPITGNNGEEQPLAYSLRRRLQGCWPKPEYGESWEGSETAAWWAIEPNVGRVAYGIPKRVDRIKALGNAVIPQIPQIIGSVIMEREGAEKPGK